LSHAGLRFNPVIFDYLQNPAQVRRHIGASRMPNFYFSLKEALAVALFLEKQMQVEGKWPEFPAALRDYRQKQIGQKEMVRAKTILLNELRCTKCHTLEGEGENQATDLSNAGYRLNPVWTQEYLAASYVFDGLQTAMPSFFYQHDHRQNQFVAMLPQPAETIELIAQYLFSLNREKREALQKTFEKAISRYPEINADLGEKIFVSQNCVACHRHTSLGDSPNKNAPDLSLEGSRVKNRWLVSYLKRPQPIRPFGFHPGSGSRMPDFKLTDAEAARLGDYLRKQKRGSAFTSPAFQPRRLSAFSMAKAQTLLKDKLSCLGCHQLGNAGGRIGPDLSSLNQRLQPAFVYQFIQNPHALQTETVMPKILLPPKTLDLIANFLLQQQAPKSDSAYLSLVDTPLHFFQGRNPEESLYLKYCAVCHGANGDGKGYNAKYLPKSPASHSDKSYMSTRSDDTLFDGVYAGGYILNKHHFMPPWGQTLGNNEIRVLVAYMRKLCQCEGPAWAGDNR
jgi:mono/diheme cytochrome c family protein